MGGKSFLQATVGWTQRSNNGTSGFIDNSSGRDYIGGKKEERGRIKWNEILYGKVGFGRQVVSRHWPGHSRGDKEDNKMKYLGWALFFGGLILALICWSISYDALRHIVRGSQGDYTYLLQWTNAGAIMWAVIAVAGVGLVVAVRRKE